VLLFDTARFDDHRIHVIEHEVMVANPSSCFWRTKAQVVDVHRGGIAVRSTR
jgi:hypothetical protein